MYIAHLCALKSQYYIYTPDIIIHQTIYDNRWEGIIVWYEGVNQWKIYILRSGRIYVLSFVWFDDNFSYYDIDHKVTDKDNKNMKLDDI